MEARYIRDGNSYFLAIEIQTVSERDYQLPMLLQNKIPGILSVHKQMLNGKEELYYEVTSYHTLSDCFEAKQMEMDDILRILLCISHVSEEIDRYLLRGSGLVMEPEYIFWDEQKQEGNFCYDPERMVSVSESLNGLARFILDHIDYEDNSSVKLAYTLFQESLKENTSIRDFAKLAAEYGNTFYMEEEALVSGEAVKDTEEKRPEHQDFVQEGGYERKEWKDEYKKVKENEETGEGYEEEDIWRQKTGRRGGFRARKPSIRKAAGICAELLTVGCADGAALMLTSWGLRTAQKIWGADREMLAVIEIVSLFFTALAVVILQRIIQKIRQQ